VSQETLRTYTTNWNVKTNTKSNKTPLQVSNRSKIVPENILKTRAVQVQQMKHRYIVCICNSTALSLQLLASTLNNKLSL